MDDKLKKQMQGEFHRLNKQCQDIKAAMRFDELAAIDVKIADLKRQKMAIRDAVREKSLEYRSLAKERTRMVQALNGQTGEPSA